MFTSQIDHAPKFHPRGAAAPLGSWPAGHPSPQESPCMPPLPHVPRYMLHLHYIFAHVYIFQRPHVQVKMREACAAWTYTSTQASHNAETLRRPRFLVFFSSDLLFPGSVFRAPAASGSRGRLPVIHSILSVMHSILSSALHERVRTPSARTARLFRFCKCGLRSFPAFRARGGWTRDGRGAA